MIDVNSAIKLSISPKRTKIITRFVNTVAVISFALVVIVSVLGYKEDWLLTFAALLPPILIGAASWHYILHAKNSLNSDELLKETSRVLSIELPKTIARRIIYYTELCKEEEEEENKYFRTVLSNDKIITNIEDFDTSSLLDTEKLQELIKTCNFKIISNVTTGVHSCLYKIKGDIVQSHPLLEHLTIGVQINVSQVEVTYDFNDTPSEYNMLEITKKTRDGAEAVGYYVRTYPEVENEGKNQKYIPEINKNGTGEFKIKARLKSEKENTNLLLDSSYKLFIIQDIAVMTGYLIKALYEKK